jgi:CubicO group peptidase (beta-lactamase class C family)
MMDLTTLVSSLTPPFAFCGIGIKQPGQRAEFHFSTAPGILGNEHSLFRAASISKIVTGRTVLALVKQQRLTIDVGIADLLGVPFHHPAHPDTPLTLRMLLCHTASLDDAGGYLIPAGTGLTDWLTAHQTNLFLPHKPGTFFSYSNLGYVLLGAAAEVLGDHSFGSLSRLMVLDDLQIQGGFNWSGVKNTLDWLGRLATYRRDGAALVAQIDGLDAVRPTWQGYRPVQDIGQLSPQGGLRISLTGALQLAQSLAHADPTPLWTPDMGPGDTQNGTFLASKSYISPLSTPARCSAISPMPMDLPAVCGGTMRRRPHSATP